MLLKKIKKKEKTSLQVIAMFGLHRFAGVSHITVLLAEYLTGVLGKRVLVIEASGKDDLVHLLTEKESVEKEFFFRDIHYVRNVSKEEIPAFCNQSYDYCILDLGSDYEEVKEYVMLADKKFLVSHVSPWYQGLDFIYERKEEVKNLHTWTLILNGTNAFISKKYVDSQIRRAIRCSIIGLEPNILRPSSDTIHLFDQMFHY